MRAILIDPFKEEFTETEWNGKYDHIYELIDCDTYTLVRVEKDNVVFVDDEGLLKNPKYFFQWKTYPQPLAGKGLILGDEVWDPEIEDTKTQPCSFSLDEVKGMVDFLQLSVRGFETTESTTTFMGREAFLIRQTPKFGPPNEEE